MMKKHRSLKRQFVLSFFSVLLLSMLLTILTFAAGYLAWVKLLLPFWRPANYSEKYLPAIERYLAAEGANLLSVGKQPEFAKLISVSGIKYQVVDVQGQVRCGTIRRPVLARPTDLLAKLNTQDLRGSTVTKYLPLADGRGRLVGEIILRYTLQAKITDENYRILVISAVLFLLFSPFVYLSLLTRLFARRFSVLLKEPVDALVGAAEKIQANDLDFHLSYQGIEEVSQLTAAFEKMRQTLRESLLREWRLEEERREMTAALTHDLNTPVTIIQGHVQTLLTTPEAEPVRLKKYLRIIEKNTLFCSQLLREMNTLVDLDRPGFQIQPQPVDILPCLQDRASEYTLLCQQKGVFFQWNFTDRRTNPTQALDAIRLTEVLNNLVSNSLRFTPSGGKIVWQGCLEDASLSFTLEDSGPGFSSRDFPHLGQKFYQGNTARSERGHHGLGLYIAATILRKHGGSLEFANLPAGGARITFTLSPMPASSRTGSSR